MNILTFDIEEWYLEKVFFGDHKEKYTEYDKYLNYILDLLDERNIKGTFFCLGGMGKDFPDIVRKIASRGHEVGCHSYSHTWLNRMSRQDLMKDTYMSIDILEQCIGNKILSYRAPAFSIGEDNKWAFEVLAEFGVTRDASVFPAERDLGGFSEFGYKSPTMILLSNKNMKEFPICTTKIIGKDIAYSGGGYFRFFPLGYIRRIMSKNNYSMTYFHLGDLVPDGRGMLSKKEHEEYFKEPGSLKNRYRRYLKSNLGKKSAFNKLMSLIRTEDFISIEQADKEINWQQVPTIEF